MDQALRQYVVRRDGGCCARFVNSAFYASRWPMLQGLPEPGLCRNTWGGVISAEALQYMTVDHVKKEPGWAIREDDPAQLWTVCPWHHVNTSWVTKAPVRQAAREYIAAANVAAAERGLHP